MYKKKINKKIRLGKFSGAALEDRDRDFTNVEFVFSQLKFK